ncbi:MAG TPA: DUF2283 domain-containing protein [Candidatus Nanoarchaeia archaeon]|nr:DUF2283 domain-containing protein [Candidatus Nanoarchaeia archaeon]
MKMTYDPDVDAMYITLRRGSVARTQELDRNTLIDLDRKGNILGVELLFVRENHKSFFAQIRKAALG